MNSPLCGPSWASLAHLLSENRKSRMVIQVSSHPSVKRLKIGLTRIGLDYTALQSLICQLLSIKSPLTNWWRFLYHFVDAPINGLRDEVGDLNEQRPQTQVLGAESTQILGELQAIRQDIGKSPANRINKAVRYGTGLLLVSVLTTGVLAYYATKWRDERDAFEVSDWKWRVMRQVNAEYATKLDGVFASDSVSEPNKIWIIQQEQADATCEAARKVAEQAKVMNAEADKLEGKSR